jgi:hypothetical protein
MTLLLFIAGVFKHSFAEVFNTPVQESSNTRSSASFLCGCLGDLNKGYGHMLQSIYGMIKYGERINTSVNTLSTLLSTSTRELPERPTWVYDIAARCFCIQELELAFRNGNHGYFVKEMITVNYSKSSIPKQKRICVHGWNDISN